MALKPDLGLRLLRDGVGPQVKLFYYDVPIHEFDVLGGGRFTAYLETPYEGEIHSLSLDFRVEHLILILSSIGLRARQRILSDLEQDPDSERPIRLPGPVHCDSICATLGQVQQGPFENYVPLDVVEIAVRAHYQRLD